MVFKSWSGSFVSLLKAFPSFTDIEIKNPSKSQLLIRAKEARRLNIIYDNNNNYTEDKNIKEILSNEKKNSNKYNDVYNIDLPNCFMRKPDKDIKDQDKYTFCYSILNNILESIIPNIKDCCDLLKSSIENIKILSRERQE